jgi:hypothetical protein
LTARKIFNPDEFNKGAKKAVLISKPHGHSTGQFFIDQLLIPGFIWLNYNLWCANFLLVVFLFSILLDVICQQVDNTPPPHSCALFN